MAQLARFHGFYLDYERMDADRYMAAAITDDAGAMAAVIRGAIRNIQPDRAMRAQYQVAKESEWER